MFDPDEVLQKIHEEQEARRLSAEGRSVIMTPEEVIEDERAAERTREDDPDGCEPAY